MPPFFKKNNPQNVVQLDLKFQKKTGLIGMCSTVYPMARYACAYCCAREVLYIHTIIYPNRECSVSDISFFFFFLLQNRDVSQPGVNFFDGEAYRGSFTGSNSGPLLNSGFTQTMGCSTKNLIKNNNSIRHSRYCVCHEQKTANFYADMKLQSSGGSGYRYGLHAVIFTIPLVRVDADYLGRGGGLHQRQVSHLTVFAGPAQPASSAWQTWQTWVIIITSISPAG